jgi:hypothetical protein
LFRRHARDETFLEKHQSFQISDPAAAAAPGPHPYTTNGCRAALRQPSGVGCFICILHFSAEEMRKRKAWATLNRGCVRGDPSHRNQQGPDSGDITAGSTGLT